MSPVLESVRDSGAVETEPRQEADVNARLLQGAALGDPAAWQELISRYGGLLASVARRCGMNAADTAEVTQTTWLRLVENVHRINQPERLAGWLATTAKRECFRLQRLGGRQIPAPVDHLAALPDIHSPSPDSGPLADERDEAVRRACRQLAPRCQRLLDSLMGEGPISYQELSRKLSMPIGSIGPTRGRCLEHLRRLLLEAGVTAVQG